MRWKTFVLPKLKKGHFQYFLSFSFIIVAVTAAFFQLSPLFSEEKPQQKPEPIRSGNPDLPKVAFACNVFWGENILPEMLDTLAQNEVKITFFIGGSWAKKNPGIVKLISESGHELGNHTYSHPHPNNLDKEQNKEQILRTESLVKEITEIKTVLYAPPYGEYNDTVLEAAQEIGYTTIMWSIDTVDWKLPSAETLKKRVLGKLHNGAIILMHPTEPTLEALPDLIAEIKSKGYTISTVSDVIKQ